MPTDRFLFRPNRCSRKCSPCSRRRGNSPDGGRIIRHYNVRACVVTGNVFDTCMFMELYSSAMAKLFLTLLLAFLTLGAPQLAAQDSQKFRLAQSYEETGDYENASRLYMELYESD